MTASSARKLRSVLCVLTCTAVILSFYSASATSFANRIMSATPRGSTAHPDAKHVYEGGQSCVTFTPSGQSEPLVDLGLSFPDYRNYIATVFIYLPKGTSVDGIFVQAVERNNYNFLRLAGPREEALSNRDIYWWEGDERANTIRITGQSGQNMSLCLVRAYDKTLMEYCECSDPCHTNKDALCTGICPNKSEDSCPRENVALGKPALMDSSREQSNASYAVNGITGTMFSAPGITSDQTQWNCVHTNRTYGPSYWQVDLGDKYTINYLTVYWSRSSRGSWMVVSVDNQTCTTFYSREEKQTLFCDSALLTGHIVRFSNENSFIDLCEVQVWVCKPDHYGTRCEVECSEGCEQGQCDYSGKCNDGCKPGWYGLKCDMKCDQCQGPCRRYTGLCDVCIDGKYGPQCDQDCGAGCRNTCDRQTGRCNCRPGYVTGDCNQKCPKGSFGQDCGQQCDEHCQGGQCHHVTGQCQCTAGYRRVNTKCQLCADGTYGGDCGKECGSGCRSTCDKERGTCDCKRGYVAGLCNQECPKGSFGQDCGQQCEEDCQSGQCHHVTGQCQCIAGYRRVNTKCQLCADGTYGRDCGKECGSGCRSTCDKERGTCDCKPGYVAGLCNQECPEGSFGQDCGQQCDEHCQGGQCHHVTGQCQCIAGYRRVNTKCQLCADGTYGRDCGKECGSGCRSTCDKERGTCDCKPGYVAGLCNQECSEGSFGQDCGQQCDEHCQGGQCHHVTGQCQCIAGYRMVNTKCQPPAIEVTTEKPIPPTTDNVAAIAGAAGGIAVAIIITLIIIIFKQRRNSCLVQNCTRRRNEDDVNTRRDNEPVGDPACPVRNNVRRGEEVYVDTRQHYYEPVDFPACPVQDNVRGGDEEYVNTRLRDNEPVAYLDPVARPYQNFELQPRS